MARKYLSPTGQVIAETGARKYLGPGGSVVAESQGGGGQTISPGSGAIAFTGNQPGIAQPCTIAPDSGAITITGYAPDINQLRTIAPAFGAISFTGNQPGIIQSGPVTVAPGSGVITITGYVPGIIQNSLALAGGANPYPLWGKWIKDRRKLEEELRKARDDELDEVLRQVEAEKPEVAKQILKKIKPKSSPDAPTDYEAVRQRFSAKLAKIIVEIQVRADDSARVAREIEEDDALFLLLLD